MASLMPFDELNILERYITALMGAGSITEEVKQDITDEVETLLYLALMKGKESTETSLGKPVEFSNEKINGIIYQRIKDKTFADRLDEYVGAGDLAKIILVADTDMHRVYNQAAHEAAIASGIKYKKRWHTQKDDKVRDTHDYLLNMEIPAEEDFFTYTGAHAPYPGGFGNPEEDCNCRCYVEYTPA